MARAKKNPDVITVDGKTFTLIGRKDVYNTVRETPYSIREFVKQINEEEICRDPLIQRTDDQWVRKQQSKLIHSILQNRPIGSILTAKGRAESQDYLVTSLLDGLQRTTAIMEYINNKFSLDKSTPPVTCEIKDEDGNISDYKFEVAGKKFSKLPTSLQNFILSYRLTVYAYEGFTDEELDDIVFCVNNGTSPKAYHKIRFQLGSDNMRRIQPICDSTLWEDNKNCKAKNDSILCCVVRLLMMLSKYPYMNLGTSSMTKFVDEDTFTEYVKISTIEELAKLVEQLAEIKFDMTDDELEFLNACNIPHIIMALKKFNSAKNPENKTFIEFLRYFQNCDEYISYEDACDAKGSGYALYSLENISARQDAIDLALEMFLDCVGDTEDTSVVNNAIQDDTAEDEEIAEYNADNIMEDAFGDTVYTETEDNVQEQTEGTEEAETENNTDSKSSSTDDSDDSWVDDWDDTVDNIGIDEQINGIRRKQEETGNRIPKPEFRSA